MRQQFYDIVNFLSRKAFSLRQLKFLMNCNLLN